MAGGKLHGRGAWDACNRLPRSAVAPAGPLTRCPAGRGLEGAGAAGQKNQGQAGDDHRPDPSAAHSVAGVGAPRRMTGQWSRRQLARRPTVPTAAAVGILCVDVAVEDRGPMKAVNRNPSNPESPEPRISAHDFHRANLRRPPPPRAPGRAIHRAARPRPPRRHYSTSTTAQGQGPSEVGPEQALDDQAHLGGLKVVAGPDHRHLPEGSGRTAVPSPDITVVQRHHADQGCLGRGQG